MRDALRDVLDGYVITKSMAKAESKFVNPTFAAARGAAELGNKTLESPDERLETAVCKWWRRMIG